MAIPNIARTSRKAQRLTEVALVLAKHGLSYFVHRLNLHRYLPRGKGLVSRPVREPAKLDEETIVRRLGLVMEELGPTFVKLGQVLSTRPDILPDSIIQEFRRFQDQVAPFGGEEARQVVERELGASLSELFDSFSNEPIASGSLAQVHRAKLKNGEDVVMKVKRPGIERKVLADIELLADLVRYAERHVEEIRVYRPTLIVEEFERSMRRELEFITEASFTSKFHEAFIDFEGVRTPMVYWDLTTSNVLTLQWLEGFNIGDRNRLKQHAIDRSKLTERLASAFMHMYFELGLFHADPHPGNLLVQEDGTLAIVDFGNSGHLTAELRSQVANVLIALTRHDMELVVQQCTDLGMFPAAGNRERLKSDMVDLLDRYYGMPLKRLDTGSVFADVTRVARDNGALLPREFVLLARSFVMVTSTAKELDPKFDLAGAMEPYARKLFFEKLSPRGALKSIGLGAYNLGRLVHKLPRQVADIIRKMDAGTWQILFKHEGLENLLGEMDRVSNRISVSIILGAIIIGSSLILHAKLGPTLFELPIFGLVGFLIAGLLGLWLVWDVLRSGRY